MSPTWRRAILEAMTLKLVIKPQPLRPEEVFTPRSAAVNSAMYVARLGLERALERALRGNPHVVIHGESGTGKSWLYQKTFADLGIPYTIANLANAKRLGSITAELKNLVDREGLTLKTGFSEKKSAEVNAVVAKGGLEHNGNFSIGQMEPFEAALALLSRRASGQPSVLVLDNLEAAFEKDLLNELANLIILCDDARYSQYNVKLLIVGVPREVKHYYYKTPHHQTVANRLTELPEVSRLTKTETGLLVESGFKKLLQYSVEDIEALKRHVAWITTGVPQMVHEYCLQLAFISEDTRRVTAENIAEADQKWTQDSMFHAISVIEQSMNERDTKAARRNQTIYALSIFDGDQMRSSEVETILRSEFPDSTHGVVINVPQMLSQLSSGATPLIKRTPRGDAFEFADPRYRMTLRAILKKNGDRVEKSQH